MISRFEVLGEPGSKGRHRTTRTGRTYPDPKTVEYENLVRLSYQEQCGNYLEGELIAHIRAYFSIPKSFSRTKRQQAMDGKLHPTKRPDADNIAKVVLDALNGVAYHDDSQIFSLSVHKRYSERPRVEVIIGEREHGGT